ncbi:ABC transporter substrate-binding protein [Radiobacillus kanasensis]|uniref:ABC transporter substrate-binding protein n=1 Tax=Radiobacillus kanasensis TaxID=2844358 RepID=UPI001E625FAB|nr:ABC transporter substrate-binding protein [Radiobacillus kanasensis]UFT98387.1 ABC transporter substrate-binding protein [Radiobacillus kanasensis]
MKIKALSYLGVLILFALALVGCSSDDASGEDGSKVTLTFGTHQSGIPRTGIIQEMAKDFEKETGIGIEFQIVPDAQWRDLIKAKLASGEAPDIFNVDVDPLSMPANVRPKENAMDLSEEEFAGRMSDQILPSVSHEGKVYGVSYAPTKIWYVYYNKKIFNDLGIKPPTNYEEFKSISQKILDSGVTPFWMAPSSNWYQTLALFETGPNYEKLNPGIYEKLNNNEMKVADMDRMKTVLEQLKEFADLGYFGENFLSNTVEAGIDAFGKGEAAMFVRVPGTETEVSDAYPEMKDNMGFFVMPWGDNQTIGINPGGSAAMFGNKNSEHKEEILEFFRWMTKHENLQRVFDGGEGNLTICWPEIESKLTPEYLEYEEAHEKGTVMQAAVKYIDPQFMDVGKDISGMFAGSLTPEEVLENIDKRRAEQAKVLNDSAWEE